MVPRAKNLLHFSVDDPGEIVETDNGDPANLVSSLAREREAFNGLCLVIVGAKVGQSGTIKLNVKSHGLTDGTISMKSVQKD